MENNNEIINAILYDIFETNILDLQLIKTKIMQDYNEIEQNFEEAKIVYSDEPNYLRIISYMQEEFNSMYNELSFKVINSVARHIFGMSIEAVIATESQDKIKIIFNNLYNDMGFSQDFRNKIDSDLEKIANRLNRRFTFDDAALINLIEASRGKNIQLEEDISRKNSTTGNRVILRQNNNSNGYHFEDLSRIRITNSMTE